MSKLFFISLILIFTVNAQSTAVKSIIESLSKGDYKERKTALEKINSLTSEEKKQLKKILKESKDPEFQAIYDDQFREKSDFELMVQKFFSHEGKLSRKQKMDFLHKSIKATEKLDQKIKILKKYDKSKKYSTYFAFLKEGKNNGGELITRYYNYNTSLEEHHLPNLGIKLSPLSQVKFLKAQKKVVLTSSLYEHEKLERLILILH